MGVALKLGVVLAVALAFSAGATSALATPTGDYAPFAECDFHNNSVQECLFAEFNGGSYTVGNKTIPLVHPIAFQGGYTGSQFYAATGQSLSETAEPVPGGMLGVTAPTWWPIGLREAFNETINEGYTGVKATLELAEPPSAIGFSFEHFYEEEPVAISLPVRSSSKTRSSAAAVTSKGKRPRSCPS